MRPLSIQKLAYNKEKVRNRYTSFINANGKRLNPKQKVRSFTTWLKYSRKCFIIDPRPFLIDSRNLSIFLSISDGSLFRSH